MLLFKGGGTYFFPDLHVCILTGWVFFLDIGWVVSSVRMCIRGVSYPHGMEPSLNFLAHRRTNLNFEEFSRFGTKTKFFRRGAKLIWKRGLVWNEDFFFPGR